MLDAQLNHPASNLTTVVLVQTHAKRGNAHIRYLALMLLKCCLRCTFNGFFLNLLEALDDPSFFPMPFSFNLSFSEYSLLLPKSLSHSGFYRRIIKIQNQIYDSWGFLLASGLGCSIAGELQLIPSISVRREFKLL